jgi:hypothetical protein
MAEIDFGSDSVFLPTQISDLVTTVRLNLGAALLLPQMGVLPLDPLRLGDLSAAALDRLASSPKGVGGRPLPSGHRVFANPHPRVYLPPRSDFEAPGD